jgi:hypothetical protein
LWLIAYPLVYRNDADGLVVSSTAIRSRGK